MSRLLSLSSNVSGGNVPRHLAEKFLLQTMNEPHFHFSLVIIDAHRFFLAEIYYFNARKSDTAFRVTREAARSDARL